MKENQEYVANPSQTPGLGQEDSSSVLLHSSKLRNKLEKLAKWRINPSLITFPSDAREFRGGYATVSQGLLASPSSAEEVASGSEDTIDEHANSDAHGPQPQRDVQEPQNDQQGKGEGADNRTPAGGGDDHSKEEGGKEYSGDGEQKSHIQTSILKTVDGPASPEHTSGEDSDWGDRNPHTQAPKDTQQGQDEGTDGRIVDGDNLQSKEEPRIESETSKNEQNSNPSTLKPKTVAVKKLKIERDTDLERALGLALRESEFLVGLFHPNIVKLEGFVENLSAHQVWLIFPWEEHGNLRDFLSSGEWEIPERISLINDVTLGLEYLHSQDPPIYHGDLKSLNILVNSEFHAIIIDFGSARHLGNDHFRKESKENGDQPQPTPRPTTDEEHITLEAFFSATASTLTLTGSTYTIRWAAPELLQDERPCLRSDIWALGWVAYEVMTNTIPFHDIKKDSIVINRVVQGHLPPVTEDARMSLIRALCSMMVKCWSIDPEKRPTAEECRKSISWMPMIVPASTQTMDEAASQLRYAQLLNKLGDMYKRQDDYPNALKCFIEALDIYTKNNDSKGRARTFCNLAPVRLVRGEHTKAVTLYSEALQIYTDAGDESQRADVLWGLAQAYRLQHDYVEAVKLYSESLQISTNIGADRTRATALWGLAEIHRLRGEYSEAFKLFSDALPIFTDVGDQREQASTLCCLAEVHRAKRECDKAIRLYSEATQILTDIGDKIWRVEALLGLAQTHQMQDHHSEAVFFYTKVSEDLEEMGESKRASDALEKAAVIRRRIEGTSERSTETVDGKKESLLTSE